MTHPKPEYFHRKAAKVAKETQSVSKTGPQGFGTNGKSIRSVCFLRIFSAILCDLCGFAVFPMNSSYPPCLFPPRSCPDFLKNPGSSQLWACNGPAIP
jgi:hypothetical protein